MTTPNTKTRPVAPANTAQHSTGEFTYDKASQTFHAEASSIGWAPGYHAAWVELHSTRTGKVEYFYFTGWPEEFDGMVMQYQNGTGLFIQVAND
jgi:hypothetical protein